MTIVDQVAEFLCFSLFFLCLTSGLCDASFSIKLLDLKLHAHLQVIAGMRRYKSIDDKSGEGIASLW